METQWISLNLFASKYGISVSTLRRRIKENSMGFKLEGGKYLVLDQAPPAPVTKTVVSQKPAEIEFQMPEHEFITGKTPAETAPTSEMSWQIAQNLIDELKSAYSKVLQEKEAQIHNLKEEVVDLKMLVKVLEDKLTTKIAQPSERNENGEFIFFDEAFKS